MKRTVIALIILAASLSLNAQTTQKTYLSGHGNDDTVEWDFYCTAGRQSGSWTKIAVPSCWECQGFGKFNYGHDKPEDRLNESGIYRYNFQVPSDWRGKKVNIVFEGVMTDARVFVNGKSAGEMHQGAFYEFRYDITKLLKYGRSNALEVRVDKHSANESVNAAERKCDFWIFGGIFRPVYLEAKPSLNIDNFAIDARADGSLAVDVATSGKTEGCKVVASVSSLDGSAFGKPFETALDANGKALLSSSFANPELWSAEFPNLYNLDLKLVKDGKTLHEISERFGFRTIEVRPSDGIYLNGVKIKFKGVDRHSHYPTSGRTLSDKINLEDALLIKEMNMNAVRMSHYPPEKRFLELCDSLGLYVLDELTGWQDAYDTEVGTKLVRELVLRDRNHPCVLLWDNGNEGGFNFDLVGEYPKWDNLQQRLVIHPWLNEEIVNTNHYPSWYAVKDYHCQDRKIWFPTEFLHGLYDGGHGAALDDFWNLMWTDPLCAGGFLWDLVDQAIIRDDGTLDTDGNHAADGIVGPYREKEGSVFAIKEIWSPVVLQGRTFVTPSFDGVFTVENRYSFTNLKDCSFEASLEKIDFLTGRTESKPLPVSPIDVEPGLTGHLKLGLPEDFASWDVLKLTAKGPDAKELYTWTRTIKTPSQYAEALRGAETPKSEAVLRDGVLDGIRCGSKVLPLKNAHVTKLGNRGFFSISDTEDGWVKFSYDAAKSGNFDYFGVSFDFPEESVKSLKWLGNGPYRVWKNRLKGAAFGLWELEANNTLTGEGWDYPEFRGFRSNMYAADIETDYGTIRILFETPDLFLHLLTPGKQLDRNNDNTLGIFPEGQISVLNAISPVGTKFYGAPAMGPQSGPNVLEERHDRRTAHASGTFYIKYLPK